MDTPSVKTRTVASTPISPARGSSLAPAAAIARTATKPSTMPSAPPNSARVRLSVSSCLAMRPRPAPSAARTESSCWRPVARASSRLAMFTHAMSRSIDTAAISTTSGRRTSPRIDSRMEATCTSLQPAFSG